MRTTYLVLAIVGFVAPNILVTVESFETGNYLLYTNLIATMESMFANRISSIFAIDLLFAILVFFIWSYHDAQRLNIKKVWQVWLLTMLFGLAGGLPLFLYWREKRSKIN